MTAFIDERKVDFGVELICRTIGASASAYYQRATGVRSGRTVRLLARIRQVHAANYCAYGYRCAHRRNPRTGAALKIRASTVPGSPPARR